MDTTKKILNGFRTESMRKCLIMWDFAWILWRNFFLNGFHKKDLDGSREKDFEGRESFLKTLWERISIDFVRKFLNVQLRSIKLIPLEIFWRDRSPLPRLNPQVQHGQEQHWKTIQENWRERYIFPLWSKIRETDRKCWNLFLEVSSYCCWRSIPAILYVPFSVAFGLSICLKVMLSDKVLRHIYCCILCSLL